VVNASIVIVLGPAVRSHHPTLQSDHQHLRQSPDSQWACLPIAVAASDSPVVGTMSIAAPLDSPVPTIVHSEGMRVLEPVTK